MADTSSGSSASGGGLGDLLSMLGGNNPIALVGKSINQFQSGITNFLHSVENFNETMEQMNGVARRINRMLDDLEPVVKAMVPQLTRTLRAADDMVEQMSGPIERVAPGLMRLAETLSSPVLTNFPRDLGQFVEMFGDVARRMQPLGQLAETAGGFFGGMNPLTALRNAAAGANRQSTPAATESSAPRPVVVDNDGDDDDFDRRPRKKSPAKSSTTHRAPAKKAAAKTGGRARR